MEKWVWLDDVMHSSAGAHATWRRRGGVWKGKSDAGRAVVVVVENHVHAYKERLGTKICTPPWKNHLMIE